jgi:hypothetical protein
VTHLPDFSFNKKIFPFFLIIFSSLNFTVIVYDVKFNSLFLASLFSFCYIIGISLPGKKLLFSKSIFVLYLVVFFLEMIVLVQVIINGYIEYNVYSFPIRVFLYTLIVISLINYFYNHNINIISAKDFFLKAVVFSFTINSLFICIEVFFPSLRDILYSFLDLGKVEGHSYYGYRFTGLMQSLPVVSYHHFIGALCALYIAFEEKRSIYFIISLAIVGVLVFVARSGICLYFFSLIFFILADKFSVKNCFIAILLIVALLFIYNNLYILQETTYPSIARTFEMMENFKKDGSLTTSSTSDLINNQWSVFPDSLYSCLFGYGTTVSNMVESISIDTDVGVLKLVFFFGISGFLLTIFVHIYLVYAGLAAYENSRFFKLFIFSLLGSLFLFNLKDYVFFGGTAFFVLVFFSASGAIADKKTAVALTCG